MKKSDLNSMLSVKLTLNREKDNNEEEYCWYEGEIYDEELTDPITLTIDLDSLNIKLYTEDVNFIIISHNFTSLCNQILYKIQDIADSAEEATNFIYPSTLLIKA